MNPDRSIRVGLLRIDGALVGLAIDCLREVVPRPPRWDALAASGPGVVGAMSLRGDVLPVLDPAGLDGRPTRGEADVVVVLAHEGLAVGLLVEGVHDVTLVEPVPTRVVVGAGGLAALTTATFVCPESGRVGSLLDPAAVLARPGVVAVALADPGPGTPEGDPRSTGRPPGSGPALLLVRCRPVHGEPVLLAVDVADVHTTLPGLSPQPSQLSGGACVGVTDYGDVRVAVVDPLPLLGLPGTDPGEDTQALLVRAETGLLALKFAQVLEIVRLGTEDLVPFPRSGSGGLVAAVARTDLGDALVLDVAAVLADPDLTALAALNTDSGAPPLTATDPTARITGGGVGGEPLVVLRAGTRMVVPLTDIDQVMPCPATTLAWPHHPAGRGVLLVGHEVVPLVDLAVLLGRGEVPAGTGVVVLVREAGGGSRTGFVVDSLDDIARASWVESDADAAAEGRDRLVQLGPSGAPLLRLLDLPGLAASIAPVAAG
ncbi:chemotaxis protein CheW [Kineococcus gynurae]|uniref:Chemotaxis protein CheW n=1 Tax=Kineococcus gynurae TaxID=452979 RepID=A0ABV5LRB4_9ACTN